MRHVFRVHLYRYVSGVVSMLCVDIPAYELQDAICDVRQQFSNPWEVIRWEIVGSLPEWA